MKNSLTYIICLLGVFVVQPLLAQDDIYSLDHIAEVRINLKEDNYHQLLDSLKERGDDQRLIADVIIDGKEYKESGIRYKGNSSYFNVRNSGKQKLPFNVKVNFVNKKQKLPGGYSTLKLSNVFRDPSFLREVLAYRIAADYMPSPRANFAKVYINDELLGLYNLTQSIDDDLLEKFFGEDDGPFFKCDPNWHMDRMAGCPPSDKASLEYLGKDSICYRSYYEIKSKYGWADLIELTYVLNKEPNKIEEILNIDEALWMLAFNSITVNLDSYTGHLGHNYYLYRDDYGIFHPMVWDMNLSFGGFRYTGSGAPLSNEKMQRLSPFLHYKEKNEKRPLITRLLSNNLYRKIYVAHIRTILEDYFQNGKYLEVANTIRESIAAAVEEDENRLYDLAYYDENLNNTVRLEKGSIIGIQELMEGRTEYLSNHPLIKHEAPVIGDITADVQGEDVIFEVASERADQLWLFHRSEDFAPFTKKKMNEAITGEEEKQYWQLVVPLSEIKQYYFVAEDDRSASVMPKKAAFEYFDVVVK